MKKILPGVVLLFTGLLATACPVCERQQPKILQGITHGSGPESNWDFVIIAVASLIVVATLFYSVKWLLRPGEKSGSHIKYLILNNE